MFINVCVEIVIYGVVVLVNYWIIPLFEENWLVVKETSVYGAPEFFGVLTCLYC
ncbi:MAG: hypothetical protein LM569_04755 [Desulfurococcaceae archaeon]|nr:hypothetical protein [Desulfurococcaceae archaeon]